MTPKRAERRKLNIVLFIICGVFVILGGRLYYIQIIKHSYYVERSRRVTEKKLILEGRRGKIIDITGREIAVSLPARTLAASLIDIKDRQAVINKLVALTSIDREHLVKRMTQPSNVEFVFLKRKIGFQAAKAVEAARIKGIHLLFDEKRTYANGRAACHVIGFTKWSEKYGDSGVAGAEGSFDATLRGEPGIRELHRDGRGRTFVEKGDLRHDPVPGYTVRLTLDMRIQNVMDSEIAKIAEKFRPLGICGLVMSCKTGRILAASSWPDFDPNKPGDSPIENRTSRVITTVIEPGSTIKPIVAAIALDAGVCKRTKRINCHHGSWRPRRGRVITDSHAYGWLSMADCVVKSSNIGMAQVGEKIGRQKLYTYCRAFGFGSSTGVGMTGESSGILHPLAKWRKDSLWSISFGHEICVTPLQIAAAYAALGNGGVLFRPQIVRSIEDGLGKIVQEMPPVSLRRVISQKTSQQIREILGDVVTRGTGRRAALKDWSLGGKTGTARKLINGTYSDSKHFASFVGLAPIEDPEIVALIIVDEPKGAHYGGQVSAPYVSQVIKKSLRMLGVPTTAQRKAEEDPQP